MGKSAAERRFRGGVIMAELGPEELERFLATCRRERRTTGFLGGRIIADWLKLQQPLQGDGEGPAAEVKRTKES